MADTDIQHLERLRTYWKRHHAFPSMAKLCEVVGMSSTASVFDLVSRLKDAGYVERVEGRIAPTKRFFARPLVGIEAQRWEIGEMETLIQEIDRSGTQGTAVLPPGSSRTSASASR